MIKPSKALFIQLRRIGDVLMCTPAIRAFKEEFPECRLDFLTELPDVLQGNPHLNTVMLTNVQKESNPIYQLSLIRKIRVAGYDLVVDFFANPRSAYYSFLSGAPARVSYGFGHRRWAYNIIPPRPANSLYAALDRLRLLDVVGVKSDDCRLEFYLSEEDKLRASDLIGSLPPGPLVSLSPVSRRAFNRWPLDHYAALGKMLITSFNAQLLILAGPGEEEAAVTVMAKIGHPNARAPRVGSLGVLGAIFSMVDLHVGNDNGPKHIAVACGAPTMTIYGPHSSTSWTYPDPVRHRFLTPREYCADCATKKRRCDAECVAKISPEAVFDAILQLARNIPTLNYIAADK